MSFAAAFKSNISARPGGFSAGIDNSSSVKLAGDDPSRNVDPDGRVMSAAEIAALAVEGIELDHMYQEVSFFSPVLFFLFTCVMLISTSLLLLIFFCYFFFPFDL